MRFSRAFLGCNRDKMSDASLRARHPEAGTSSLPPAIDGDRKSGDVEISSIEHLEDLKLDETHRRLKVRELRKAVVVADNCV